MADHQVSSDGLDTPRVDNAQHAAANSPPMSKDADTAAATHESPVAQSAVPASDDVDANPGVLGEETAELIDFKTLTWWQGGIVLIAETVSLGILSLPSVLATIGLAPGIVLIIVMSLLSTYSGLMLAEFRREYPFVQNFGDAVEIMGKSIGMGAVFQELFGWAQVIFQVFVMGGHILLWTICLNTLSNSSTCTIVWAVVGLAVFWSLNVPRTLKWTSWMSMTSCISITVAVLMTLGDVAEKRPIGSGSIAVSRELGFTSAFLAVTNIAIAFSSHSCFFTVIGEFKEPRDWPKALAFLQIIDTTLYLVAAIVIYVYVGPTVPSPALSAAGTATMRKAIWGIAIPTIVIAGVIYAHVASEYVFSRIFRNTKHMVRRTKTSTVAWLAVTAGLWAVAMVIAESIPVFNSLLGLICALFVSWFSYGLPGILWLWMNYGSWFSTRKQTLKFIPNVILLITGFLLCVLGTWSSIVAIAGETGTQPWTCASNAAS